MWTTKDLLNESDVEQKFLFPFLTGELPTGLGLPPSVVHTKESIRRFPIDKGSAQKLYFPDYLVVAFGMPVVVIEAKGPGESVEVGFREARLYAAELNSLYPHGLSPTSYVLASNGIELWYGHSDHVEPIGKAKCADLGPYSADVANLINLISWTAIHKLGEQLAARVRPHALYKPRRLLGGIAIQNEEVGINTFGTTLTASISPIFNPTTSAERAAVAQNAYVPSRRRERYVDPIDKVIRAARPPSQSDALEIANTERPTEVIRQLQSHRSLEHKILLLIGSVGSGKSTFVDHLLEVALPKDLLTTTVWCRINMNAAPIAPAEIYAWLRRELVNGCRASLPDIDFDDLDSIRKVFGTEIQQFRKGVGRLYEKVPETFDIKLAEHLQSVMADQVLVANAHVRFCCAQRGKLLVVVLDNCDKKTRDEQLLMFEAAQWLQKEFRCLVILPLRDETYDNHRNQPPLDTALKDLVFRIEPPLFQTVLLKRMQFALRSMSDSKSEKLQFTLPNGFTVEYPQSDQAYYLTCIVKSLFEHDLFARRMIVGLSGRNMRRALEIFLEFCGSGHIGEDQIFRMRQSNGTYSLPLHQVATVLMRMNRRFYDSDSSYVKNMFSAREDDPLPSFLCRYMILRWLRLKFDQPGPIGLRGYFAKQDVKHDLMPYGLEPAVVDRELNYLLDAQCVIAEHLRVDHIADSDLLRLGPAGFVHLDLLSNINYLAAVAEDTLFPDRIQAEDVAQRIRNIDTQLTKYTALSNAAEVVEYLEKVRASVIPPNGPYLTGDLYDRLTDLAPAKDALARMEKSQADDPWFGADKRLLRGRAYQATIVNSTAIGHFTEFDDGLVGLIHHSNFGGVSAQVGDRVEVQIQWVDVFKRRIGLILIRVVEEEAGDPVLGAHGQGNLFQ